MKSAVEPTLEANCLEGVSQDQTLNTSAEEEFDELARLAAQICETPMALIVFSAKDGLWVKSRIGIDAPNIAGANWTQALEASGATIIEDASLRSISQNIAF